MPSESHGRLSLGSRIRSSLLIAVPAVLALIGGAWLSFEALNLRFESEKVGKFRELSSLAHAVSGEISDEVSLLRMQALAIRELQRADSPDLLPALFSHVLCAAEVQAGLAGELKAGGQVISRLLKRPGWADGIFLNEAYLARALSFVDWTEFGRSGMATIRMKQDPSRNAEWLAFLFPLPGGLSRGVALIVVDPMEAFPVFARSSHRSEGGNLKSYLIARDGTVLAHSERGYAGADFSGTEVFRSGISALLEGNLEGNESGSGTFLSIDQLPVNAAYVKASVFGQGFPLAMVVERIASPAPSELSITTIVRGFFGKLAKPLFLVLLSVGAAILGVTAALAGDLYSMAEARRFRSAVKAKEASEMRAIQSAIEPKSPASRLARQTQDL